jgi:imidazolonepropionase-like amidohydrolase
MTLDPDIRSPADQLKLAPEQVVRSMEERAGAMLRAGITTARDLGGGEWLEIGLRDRIARGELAGPRLLCAGQPLTVRGGHCHFWGGIVSGSDEIRSAIERQVEHGADLVKVMATGGVMTRGVRITDPQFSRAELELIRAEAERHGRVVAAHCHGTAGIRNATDARLRTIEHCSFAGEKGFGDDFDPALPARIAGQDTWISPTVNAGWRRFLADKRGEPTRFMGDMRAIFRALREAGARLIASTDAGIPGVRHHELAKALEVFAIYTELAPAAVLRTATSESARALELEDETGRLLPGLCADLLVVAGDPTRDLAALHEPRLVLARGVALEP